MIQRISSSMNPHHRAVATEEGVTCQFQKTAVAISEDIPAIR